MNLKIGISFLFLIILHKSLAQFNFEYSDSIIVKKGSDTLDFAWAGGLNYTQFSDIDFDFDGDLDLLIFDRSSDNIRLFSQEINGSKKFYSLKYNARKLFPQDLRYRLTTADYDNDGRKDLFTYGIGGIKVYRNIGDATNGLTWELAKEVLYSNYSGNYFNLYVSSSDIPAIVDVEGDGDLDVLTFHIGGEHLQYHQNQSMELYGIPDSLVFELKNECWGGFREDLNTNTVYLNDNSLPCTSGNVSGAEMPMLDEINKLKKPGNSVAKHSGSTVLAIDMDNSGVLDLILGDVSFPNMNLLMNGGTLPNSNSAMISQDNSFPSNSFPVDIQVFPAAFWVDVDLDGKKDLIAAPNARNTSENETSIRFYKNLGSNSQPIFSFQTNSFLQNEMIEHGVGSIPVFSDFNNDGLEDLFVSNFFRYIPVLNKEGSIAYYKNSGTGMTPEFTFMDFNFLDLNSAGFGLRMVPTFGDLDNDNDDDLIIGRDNGTLLYFKNISTAGNLSFASPINNFTDNNGNPIDAVQAAFPELFDLNNDGLLDLIIGKKTGELLYYQNIGTPTNASFQLVNDTLGNIDLSVSSADGYAAPHFFRFRDTTYLFLGGSDGKLHYYKNIDGNISSGESFQLVSHDFLNIDAGAYSSFWVNDIDQDNLLDLFVGQDLGGLIHLEVDPNSQASINVPEKEIQFTVYPNPCNGIFSVHTNENDSQLMISDVLGRMIVQKKLTQKDTIIDIVDQSPGLYVVTLTCSGKKMQQKLLKQF